VVSVDFLVVQFAFLLEFCCFKENDEHGGKIDKIA
jgi:hypothetical protein